MTPPYRGARLAGRPARTHDRLLGSDAARIAREATMSVLVGRDSPLAASKIGRRAFEKAASERGMWTARAGRGSSIRLRAIRRI